VSDRDAYHAAGVSQRDADRAVEALLGHLQLIDTGKPSRVVHLPGHYASVLRLGDEIGIAIGTDGVGTKMIVAERLGRFDTIGIDCVAMNVNDLICVGAEPVAMVDFILCERADPEVCGEIGIGLRRGAELAGIEIPGGEIAQVGEIVDGWELAGTAIGTVALDALVTGESIEPGDAVLGLPSSGLHSNGYTLARRVLADLDPAEDPDGRLGRPLGDELLEPTEIYARAVLALLASQVDVRGLAHITGDGLRNLTRLAAPVGYEIDDALPVPPVFDLIRERGRVSEEEMYDVFNMGCGFCCVVADADAEAAVRLLERHHPGTRRIGRVSAQDGVVERR
jgi:phosphoribosylformylglycinamidine cyclo-ligase